MLEEIQELFAYQRWANRRMLTAASALSAEQLSRDVGSSFPSVLATLAHMLSADWIWLERWHGRSPGRAPEGWDLSSFERLLRHWDEVETAQSDFLRTLREEDLRRVLEYRTMKGDPSATPMRQVLRHVVNHGTYHRGQLATMLRQLGSPAPGTDLVLFYRERAPAASPA